MEALNPPDICRLLGEFEETHDVEHYEVFGQKIWPMLRFMIGDQMSVRSHSIEWARSKNKPDAPISPARRIGQTASFFLSPMIDFARWAVANSSGVSPTTYERCDVLIFGSGQRYQKVGEAWTHYATAPLNDLLRRSGLNCKNWQWDRQPYPAYQPAADVRPPLVLKQRLLGIQRSLGPRPPPPAWWDALNSFHIQHLGRDLNWNLIVEHFSGFRPYSKIIERWLRRAQPGLLVVDCWTNWPAVAASVAAHRLGIPVLELQHGIQEQSHSAYHGWRKEPSGGWDMLPDAFWVWGSRAEALYKTNRITHEVIRGGSLWLRQWVNEDAPDIAQACKWARSFTAGSDYSILVTLGDPASHEIEFLNNVLAESPSNWRWLVRMHPNSRFERAAILSALNWPSHAIVNVYESSEWPLFAMLKAVDLHVTNCSTSTNEALAFGTPSITFGELGLSMFDELIQDGIVFHTPDASGFYAAVARASQCNRELMRQAAESLFTLDADSVAQAVKRIHQIVRKSQSAKTSHFSSLGSDNRRIRALPKRKSGNAIIPK
jgi:hypothetical protein